MARMLLRIVMWWLHREYLRYGKPIYYIKGEGKDYPKYLLYTEDEHAYKRMEDF